MRAVGGAWLEGRRGEQKMCEHVLSDRMIVSGGSGIDRLYCFFIRVQRRVQGCQVLLFRHSGVEKAAFAKAPLAGIIKILFEKRSGKW